MSLLEWLKSNAIALVLAVASMTGSAVVGGRLLGQLDSLTATVARLERATEALTVDVSSLRERTSALDERTRRP